MRNFRTAAVAAATAATVAFAGTTTAFAQEENTEQKSSFGSSISDWGKDLDSVDEDGNANPVTGVDLFGSSVDDENNPEWAKVWRDGTYAIAGTAVIGAIIGAYNYAVYNNIIPQHFLDPIFR